MNKDENTYWNRFAQSGQIVDYLLYSKARTHSHEVERKPMRRIADSSYYKKFY